MTPQHATPNPSEPLGIEGYQDQAGLQQGPRPWFDVLRILQIFFILCTVVVMLLVGMGCAGAGNTPGGSPKEEALYLIPQGFTGPVLIVYEQKGQPKLSSDETAERVYTIPESGVLLTSSPYIGGIPKDNYHWLEKGGKTGEAIVSDPTGFLHGHTTETLGERDKQCWIEWFFVDKFDNIERHRYALEVLKAKYCGLNPPPKPPESVATDDTAEPEEY